MTRETFRSRGFRLNFKEPTRIQQKIYYEADSEILKLIKKPIPKHILNIFEYSVVSSNEIDSLNFHVDLTLDISSLYLDISDDVLCLFSAIPNIFDKSFLNYTVGYRFRNLNLIGQSFYFYPTIWKKNKFGIKGITDKHLINGYLKRFIDYFDITDKRSEMLIRKYFSLICKFKGVSITIDNDSCENLKLYAKLASNDFEQLIAFMINHGFLQDYEILKTLQGEYGEVVLFALRVEDKEVSSFNIYFLN